MKNVTFIAVIILFSGYILWDQLTKEECVSSEAIGVLLKENDSLKRQKIALIQQVYHLQHQADSLLQKATIERQEVVKFKTMRDEKIMAVDDFDDRQLYDFFAGVKTDSAANK
jgi:hypothetical protein